MPFALELGAGLASHASYAEVMNETGVEPAFEALVAARLDAHVAIGLHVGSSYLAYDFNEQLGNESGHFEHYAVDTIDVGLGIELEHDRFWIAPWFGAHLEVGTHTMLDISGCLGHPCTSQMTSSESVGDFRFASFGVTAGVDLSRWETGRLAAFVAGQAALVVVDPTGMLPPSALGYTALSLGLAYRR